MMATTTLLDDEIGGYRVRLWQNPDPVSLIFQCDEGAAFELPLNKIDIVIAQLRQAKEKIAEPAGIIQRT